MSVALAGKIREFVFNTISGHESGLFKSIPLLIMQDMTASSLIAPITLNYFNTVYESLVKEDDEYVNEQFGEMQKLMDHSPVCLINMLFVLTMKIHTSMDRKKLDMSSYGKYMVSVREELKKIPSAEQLAPAFGHKCAGPKKSTTIRAWSTDVLCKVLTN